MTLKDSQFFPKKFGNETGNGHSADRNSGNHRVNPQQKEDSHENTEKGVIDGEAVFQILFLKSSQVLTKQSHVLGAVFPLMMGNTFV